MERGRFFAELGVFNCRTDASVSKRGKGMGGVSYFVAGVACQGGDAGLNGAGSAVHVRLQGAWAVVGRHGCFCRAGRCNDVTEFQCILIQKSLMVCG